MIEVATGLACERVHEFPDREETAVGITHQSTSQIPLSIPEVAEQVPPQSVKHRSRGEDKQQLQRVMASATTRGFSELRKRGVKRVSPSRLSVDDQVKAMVDVLTEASKEAKRWFVKNRARKYLRVQEGAARR